MVAFTVAGGLLPYKAFFNFDQTILRFSFPLLVLAYLLSSIKCEVLKINENNLDSILQSYDVVFVNFYADWCRFSRQFYPIFEEASDHFKDRGRAIAWATVDCDRETEVAQKYHVNKYPTLKLFRNGILVKKEYRGQRSVEALKEFMEKFLSPSVINFTSTSDLEAKIDQKKRNIVAYFEQPLGIELDNFLKIASLLRDDCTFWLGIGESFRSELAKGNKLEYRIPDSSEKLEYTGGLANLDITRQWVTDKCIPLVREITFENAEELTEEGLPFLLLFRDPDDTQIEKIFTEQVVRELYDQKSTINCLFADGKKFAHPLHHLGKTIDDLPILAIDSFRHMYLFPDMQLLTVPGKLRQFVLDLHSGKLHREFHHGPDPAASSTAESATQVTEKDSTMEGTTKLQPPTSVFKQLKPSETRYSLLYKDEL